MCSLTLSIQNEFGEPKVVAVEPGDTVFLDSAAAPTAIVVRESGD